MKKSSPKDVFLHLLSIVALYTSAVSFITLLFQYINALFPDPLNPYYYEQAAGPIRWAMASLIIVFPVYIFVSWLLNKDYASHPEKRELKIRKWLVYFTLFIAALVIISDFVSLVYNFLGGDLTARFALKVLAILLVAGTIFSYYFWNLRKQLISQRLKILAWIVSAAVLATIVVGFFTAGSPLKARLYKFDSRRIGDLQIMQSEIINYWAQKDKLPGLLSDLENTITGFVPPRDPETNKSYEYRILSSEPAEPSFELCAEFNLASKEPLAEIPRSAPYYETPYQQNWSHESGRVCFERFIDPELYIKRVELKD